MGGQSARGISVHRAATIATKPWSYHGSCSLCCDSCRCYLAPLSEILVCENCVAIMNNKPSLGPDGYGGSRWFTLEESALKSDPWIQAIQIEVSRRGEEITPSPAGVWGTVRKLIGRSSDW